MTLRNVAVVLAGGSGVRVGLATPKQLIRIAGKPIIEHTIAALHASPLIDEILVMMVPGHLDPVRHIVKSGEYHKVSQVLEGAVTRNETTAAALAALGDAECNVIFHDAVRPLLSQTIIEANVDALRTHSAVDTVIPSADTVIQVEPDGAVLAKVLQRHLLRRGQTPQSFRLSTIREAYARAAQDADFTATDDCTVVLRYLPEVPIAAVPGHERNMKITEPIDVYIADKLFQLTSAERPLTLDSSALRRRLEGKTMVIFGGSYGIGGDIAALAQEHGAQVHSFSRSSTNTHVEKRDQIKAAASAAVDALGHIDYVVNAAGILPRGTLVETTEETIYSATEVNYLAPLFIAQEFFPHLASAGGSLLFFTSSSYTRGRSGYSLYSSAKAAVVNLTQALADEWSRFGVRVNCVNPERTGTPMRTSAFGSEDPGTLLSSSQVAAQSLDVLLSQQTGQIIDIRRDSNGAGAVSHG